ncbi:hypothetical protein KM043_013102 [Ampulex compressa]|nr:hypothetical protein KM043_013102 [Ampulex compressa]
MAESSNSRKRLENFTNHWKDRSIRISILGPARNKRSASYVEVVPAEHRNRKFTGIVRDNGESWGDLYLELVTLDSFQEPRFHGRFSGGPFHVPRCPAKLALGFACYPLGAQAGQTHL